MPGLISPVYLDCILYVYPTEEDAKGGRRLGGSGFLVGVLLPLSKIWQAYAVTAGHVVRQMKSPVLRVNRRDAKEFECLKTDEWIESEEDDIAVTAINASWENYDYYVIVHDDFVDAEKFSYIGPGDEVFMVGRFVDMEGRQRNTPTVRFGNISMLPEEEPFYLVEHHSLPGYSGSPVFVRIDADQRGGDLASIHRLSPGYPKAERPRFYGPWLLGLDSFHVQNWMGVHDAPNDAAISTPKRWVKSNSGMAGIVPAWRIWEFLNSEKLMKQRHEDDQKLKAIQDEKVEHRSYDAATTEQTEFTKSDFESALRKVGRKIGPK